MHAWHGVPNNNIWWLKFCVRSVIDLMPKLVANGYPLILHTYTYSLSATPGNIYCLYVALAIYGDESFPSIHYINGFIFVVECYYGYDSICNHWCTWIWWASVWWFVITGLSWTLVWFCVAIYSYGRCLGSDPPHAQMQK